MTRPASSLELRHLRAFVAVAEERNFTRAAASLHITQPALSRTIVQLERLVGAPLVMRTRHSVELAEAGTRFLLYARHALAAVDEAVAAARNESRLLRVGFTWGAASQYSAVIVRAFEDAHPDVTIEVRRYDEPLGGLTDGRAHVAILPGRPKDAGVRTVTLTEESRVVVVPAEHPLARRRSVRLSALKDERLVVNVISGTTTPDLWEPDEAPRAIVPVHNVDEWLEAIAAGRGVGLTVASAASFYRHPGVRYRPMRDAPPAPVVVAWPATAPHPLAQTFAEFAKRTVAEGAAPTRPRSRSPGVPIAR